MFVDFNIVINFLSYIHLRMDVGFVRKEILELVSFKLWKYLTNVMLSKGNFLFHLFVLGEIGE